MTKSENTLQNLQDMKIVVLWYNLQVLRATMKNEQASQQVSRTIVAAKVN